MDNSDQLKKKVRDALDEAIKHYKEVGGLCVLCDEETHKCMVLVNYDESKDKMGPFYVFPICDECKRKEATDVSTIELKRKFEDALSRRGDVERVKL